VDGGDTLGVLVWLSEDMPERLAGVEDVEKHLFSRSRPCSIIVSAQRVEIEAARLSMNAGRHQTHWG
jgi:hypothetical protein